MGQHLGVEKAGGGAAEAADDDNSAQVAYDGGAAEVNRDGGAGEVTDGEGDLEVVVESKAAERDGQLEPSEGVSSNVLEEVVPPDEVGSDKPMLRQSTKARINISGRLGRNSRENFDQNRLDRSRILQESSVKFFGQFMYLIFSSANHEQSMLKLNRIRGHSHFPAKPGSVF